MEFRGGEGLIDIFMRLVAAKLSETNIANLANVVKNDSVLKNIFGNLMIYRLLHIWIVCVFSRTLHFNDKIWFNTGKLGEKLHC